MNVDLELYKIFYVVAKNKNMTKASEELYISQPAISQAIKKLETQLGGPLFLRSNKGMELTKEGEMFFDYVRGALDLIHNAENEFTSFQNLSKGSIHIGCSTTLTKLLLLDTIEQFHKDYPNIEIKITNDLTSNLILDLQKGKLDFIIFHEGVGKENGVALEKLIDLKQGFLYHPNYYKDTISSFSELTRVPLILQKKGSNSRSYLDLLALKNKTEFIPKMEVVSQDLLLEFVQIGLGVGFCFVDFAKMKFPNLKELKINKKIPSVPVFLATGKNVQPTFASRELIRYLKLRI